MNNLSVNVRSLERFPAKGMLSLNPSSSFLDDERGDYIMGPPKVARSMCKLEGDLQTSIVIIDENALSRNCLMHCLAAPELITTVSYSNVERMAAGWL